MPIQQHIMDEQHIGKEMTKTEIFNAFTDQCVAAQQIAFCKYIIEFVGRTQEEVEAWIMFNSNNRYHDIFLGKLSRRGTQVVQDSRVMLHEIIGEWYGTSQGIEWSIILLPAGKAITLISNPYLSKSYYSEYDWYVEDDIFTLENGICLHSYRGSIIYKDCREVPHHFASLELEKIIPCDKMVHLPQNLYKHHIPLDYFSYELRLQNQYDFYKEWGMDCREGGCGGCENEKKDHVCYNCDNCHSTKNCAIKR
jgi:hypothetical protein